MNPRKACRGIYRIYGKDHRLCLLCLQYDGFWFRRKCYERCLIIELLKAGFLVEAQKAISVFYYEEHVGEFVADIIVNDTVILELKAVKLLAKAHEVQLVNYLTATGQPVGLLINFGEEKVEIKRKVKDLR